MGTKQTMLARPLYGKRLSKSLKTPNVKVLTGLRRSGKSTLLKMFVRDMVDEGFPECNIFYRRFDQFGMPVNPDAAWLIAQLEEAIAQADPDQPFRVFLDEIQEVSDWEKVVRQLHTRENTDVFITGSNAYVLSSDLSTFLAGRYEEIRVYPLSFKEYCDFADQLAKDNQSVDELFQSYLLYGGMPGLFHLADADQQTIAENLTATFDAIVLNDVARRARISDADLLTKIVRYVFSTSGSLFSTKKIADSLTSSGRKTKSETIDNYLLALEMAFTLHECEQEGLSGKEVLRPLKKLYPADTGFRNLTTHFSGADLGYQLENVVFLELLRRGCDIHVGALPHAEVDFVADRVRGRAYFQVTTSLVDDGVHQRELSPLEGIRDSFPKTLLTLDGWRTGITETGIKIQKITDWLLED